ncbi:U3 small nucleolar RNA-associated protein 22 [Venturia nashicola]|nr:U3 small nucleolar RNA-associated protein 22 [Venturia nashicola]
MRYLSFVLPLALLLPALANPNMLDREADLSGRDDHHLHEDFPKDSFLFNDRHKWIPAEHILGSSRSPCPFLNTMANHGFLPRDGGNLSMSDFDKALSKVVNFGDEFIQSTFTPPQFHLLGALTGSKATPYTFNQI